MCCIILEVVILRCCRPYMEYSQLFIAQFKGTTNSKPKEKRGNFVFFVFQKSEMTDVIGAVVLGAGVSEVWQVVWEKLVALRLWQHSMYRGGAQHVQQHPSNPNVYSASLSGTSK